PEKFLQGHGIRVERRKDKAVVALDLRGGDQSPCLAVKVLVVIVLESGNADQAAFEVVGPAVVRAHEACCPALFRPADCVSSMAAGVEQHLYAALFVSNDDDAVLADVIEEEVARIRNLALVGHEVPRPGEDLFELEAVDL